MIQKLGWLAGCDSGSRPPLLFLVELGAVIKVASTTVLVISNKPLGANLALMTCRIFGLRSCSLGFP